MDSPSDNSATNGRLTNVGSLSFRSSRLTNTVVLADARSGGEPPTEGARERVKTAHIHTKVIPEVWKLNKQLFQFFGLRPGSDRTHGPRRR